MTTRSKGGNIATINAKATVNITEKSAAVAVPVDKAPLKPEIKKAKSIDEALKILGQSYSVKLRKADDTVELETIEINELADFDEATISAKSVVLSEQSRQKVFLSEFLNELQSNPTFSGELQELFSDKVKRNRFFKLLESWRNGVKKNESEFLKFIKSS